MAQPTAATPDLEKSLDEFRAEVNRRFDDLRADMVKIFEDYNAHMDKHFKILCIIFVIGQTIIAALILALGSLNILLLQRLL